METTNPDRKTLRPLLYTTKEVAFILGMSMERLEQWRRQGDGPEFIKIGRMVRYTCEGVQAWVAAQKEGDT